MATTYRDLQSAVLQNLHSGTADQEQRCALTAPITNDTDLTFVVDDASQISRGLIEIDSEMLWVKSVDPTSNTVTLSPFGRGYGETTAATHDVNAMVVNTPRYPRQAVKNAINDTINGLYPDVFVPRWSADNIVYAPGQLTYEVASDVGWLIRLEWESTGPSQSWVPIRRWRFDATPSVIEHGIKKTVDILDPIVPGRAVKYTYGAAPTDLSAADDTDPFAPITGLTEDCRDLVVFGATARLLQAMDSARLQPVAIEQQNRAEVTPPGAASSAARSYWQLYQMRLQQQRDQLQRLYSTVSHLTR